MTEVYLESASGLHYKMAARTLAINGILTTPASLAALKKDPLETISSLDTLLSGDDRLFVQVVETEYSRMLAEATKLANLDDDLILQIPATRDGLQVMLSGRDLDLHICACCASSLQAFLAARNGADYIELYLNQMLEYTQGIQVIKDVKGLLQAAGLKTKILVSSFRNSAQVVQAILAGADAVALNFDLLQQILKCEISSQSARDFEEIWKKTYGKSGFFIDPAAQPTRQGLEKMVSRISGSEQTEKTASD